MLLSVENISLKFGHRMILDDVSLRVKEGTIVALTGKSGSGKTTLLGIISGLLNPLAGKVIYRNKNILKWGDFKKSRFRNREIGFVFQFFNLLPDMTSYQNIRYPTTLRFFAGNVDREIMELADFLNIKKILNQSPATLSGGERQRVAIARAIINHPRIILADEPTGNLDLSTAEDIKNLFLRLKKEDNIAIVLVTHDQTLVDIADEHYHLEDGKLTKISGRKIISAKPRRAISLNREKKTKTKNSQKPAAKNAKTTKKKKV